MEDFFVNYTSAAKVWAVWVGFVLEEEGFTVAIQARDFRPGSNFFLETQRAATEADRTIMVLSPDYLKSQFAFPEWAAAFAQDPQGLKRKLVPAMVRQCQPPGLLSSVVHISLAGVDESAGQIQLLNGLDAKRAKPAQRPSFPGLEPVERI
ncbi:toll/interleukin-1 receptor domain-containing protein [Bradyrhizobium iriomotense]|nr:toll/interleukin-1 receptor domain-containing protein [Bradyrhizobium iriomotense]